MRCVRGHPAIERITQQRVRLTIGVWLSFAVPPGPRHSSGVQHGLSYRASGICRSTGTSTYAVEKERDRWGSGLLPAVSLGRVGVF
jgi:hypothetical protein